MRSSARILVVDDEADTVELIRFTLETAGLEVDQAMDGTAAIDKITNETFDVILLDIMMPDLSGFDVLQQLRSQNIDTPPVIFLTARKNSEDKRTGQNLGASGYLTKPAKRGDLLDAIEAAIEGA
jgi:two-component system alkaline phosphatase synthesis response regulator PhoP